MEVTSKKAKCDQCDPLGHISENPAPYNQGMQQGPLFDMPLPTLVIKNTINKDTTMQEPQNSRVPPDVPKIAILAFQ